MLIRVDYQTLKAVKDRFNSKLRQAIELTFASTIQPVDVIDEWGEVETNGSTGNLQTGNIDILTGSTIPPDEEWEFLLLYKETTTASCRFVAILHVNAGIEMGVTALATADVVSTNLKGAYFRRGDYLYAEQTSNAGDASRSIAWMFHRRKIA